MRPLCMSSIPGERALTLPSQDTRLLHKFNGSSSICEHVVSYCSGFRKKRSARLRSSSLARFLEEDETTLSLRTHLKQMASFRGSLLDATLITLAGSIWSNRLGCMTRESNCDSSLMMSLKMFHWQRRRFSKSQSRDKHE